jgi:phasin family protein
MDPALQHGWSGRQASNQPEEDTVSKSKNTTDKTATDPAEFIFGAEALKTGFEKTAKYFETVGEFHKDTVEAYIESATVVGKGLQEVAQDSSAYAKKAIEDAVSASKAMMSSKSINEVIELQTSFAKNAFAGYVSEISRINQAFVATAKEGSAPLQARVEAAGQLMRVAQS